MNAPTALEVKNDLLAAIDAFEGSWPDGRERAGATLALCRTLLVAIIARALNIAQPWAGAPVMRKWDSAGRVAAALPSCHLCGGLGEVGYRTRVPCPACGGA